MKEIKLIDQKQLATAKVYTDRWHWATTLKTGMSILEVGVAAGDFSEHLIKNAKPSRLVLLDKFDQCDPALAAGDRPLRYKEGQNLEFVKNRFKDYNFVEFLVGDTLDVLPKLTKEKQIFDVIYIDASHRIPYIESDIKHASEMIDKNGFLAINDYIAWDQNGEKYDVIYSVNKFLDENTNWYVSGIALERNMYSDIYLRKY